MPTNKKILIITYVFPPVGGAGVQRTVKLVKYLHALGWETHILTAKNPSVPLKDFTLVQDIPSDTRIHKAFTIEVPYFFKQIFGKINSKGNRVESVEGEGKNKPAKTSYVKQTLKKTLSLVKNALFLPDPQIGWVGSAVSKAQTIIIKYNIENVFISAPPFSSLLIGPKLKKRVPSVKIIADFRDEWSGFYLKAYKFHDFEQSTLQKVLLMEKSTVAEADLVTMATESFCRYYRKEYPDQCSKFHVLTNGYDPDDFNHDDNLSSWHHDKFNITYTGTIFNVTTVCYFFQAIEKLLERRPELTDRIKLNFFGRITDDEKVFFDNFSSPDLLERYGYVEHKKSTMALKKSDLLLVIIDDLEGSERIIAAKTFEYIYSATPVLALVPPDGETGKIIQETKTGVAINNRDVDLISEKIEEFIDGKIIVQPDKERIEDYSRKNLAKKLVCYIDEMHKM